jgi:cytochrome o ubiquinol oxidase operon protein cyoD
MEQSTNNFSPNLQSYIAGYAIAILLTLAAFALAYIHISSDHRIYSHVFLMYAIAGLAMVQLITQSIFFLHLSRRKSDRSKFVAYLFTIYSVAFIVIGSIWIMNNLNNNMSPEQVAKYMHNED